ncbi:cytochrome P450 [Aquimarina algiphila]|uniref:cytochrome P450 n=1 Tax=Aquimarina algiphila TaxID=2047982 RepID=UPI0024911A38|nr:cytochrome P450 [Aquimarina algiphila]
MKKLLFLQSEVKNPFALYEIMLKEGSIHWDKENKTWVSYSYDACTTILNSADVLIPQIDEKNVHQLNEFALHIKNGLVRLSNGMQHEITREITMYLFDGMKKISIDLTLQSILSTTTKNNKVDWVDTVCKQLPALVILQSFDFGDEECDLILGEIELLKMIMLPHKNKEQVARINSSAERIFKITENHILEVQSGLVSRLVMKYKLEYNDAVFLCISNLIGLLIQSYDGCRGILSNAILRILKSKEFSEQKCMHQEWVEKMVIETLRFDPPFHHTKRIVGKDIVVNNITIKKGASIVVMLAAANRDKKKFNNPSNFSIERHNANECLTFGMGSHMCLAKHFSIHLTTETIYHFLKMYKTITLLENDVQYEPVMHARLPKQITLSF